MIGDEIEVKLLDIKESQVKIGVVAPRDIPVHRREVYLAIKAENAAASAASDVAEVSKLIDG